MSSDVIASAPRATLIVDYRPRHDRQKIVMDKWPTTRLLILTGEAGTGKTTTALGHALLDVLSGRTRKIILSRPTITADEDHGFLPGDLKAKFSPWLGAFSDVLGDLTTTKMERLDKIIETVPVGFLRGRTFKHSTLIVDEAQNCTWAQLKLAGSRVGHGAKVVFCGDPEQSDLPLRSRDALLRCIERTKGLTHCTCVKFLPRDQMREPFVTAFLDAMSD